MEMQPRRATDLPSHLLAGRAEARTSANRGHEASTSRSRRLSLRRAGTALAILPLALLVACGAPDTGDPAVGEDHAAASSTYALDDRADGPLPETFGLGRPATEAEIAAVDVDVMPDGHGLPAESGSATDGAALYAGQCAICHGENLEGTPLAARLVPAPGDTVFPDGEVPSSARAIGNYWPYATTLFDYIRRAMPFDRPGSLTDEEVYAVTAYLLARNGIVAADATLDSASLAAVRMPARDHFVPDDRLESDRVR